MINLDTYEAKMAFVHQLNAECNIFQGEDMEENDDSIPYSGKYFDAFPIHPYNIHQSGTHVRRHTYRERS